MRNFALCAGIFGLTGVLLGAFGAHALKSTLLLQGTREAWETAVLYQLVHAAALLSLARGRVQDEPNEVGRKWIARAGLCWSVGIVLFSGSLYVLAVGGPRLFGPVTPFGGIVLIAGWGCMLAHAWTIHSEKR